MTYARVLIILYIIAILAIIGIGEYSQATAFQRLGNANATRLLASYATNHDPAIKQRLCTLNRSLGATASHNLQDFAKREHCHYD